MWIIFLTACVKWVKSMMQNAALDSASAQAYLAGQTPLRGSEDAMETVKPAKAAEAVARHIEGLVLEGSSGPVRSCRPSASWRSS